MVQSGIDTLLQITNIFDGAADEYKKRLTIAKESEAPPAAKESEASTAAATDEEKSPRVSVSPPRVNVTPLRVQANKDLGIPNIVCDSNTDSESKSEDEDEEQTP
jgi:hypothetical protein